MSMKRFVINYKYLKNGIWRTAYLISRFDNINPTEMEAKEHINNFRWVDDVIILDIKPLK